MKHLMRDIAQLHKAFDQPVRVEALKPDHINDLEEDSDSNNVDELFDKKKRQGRLMFRLRTIAEEFLELLTAALGVTEHTTLPEDVDVALIKQGIESLLSRWRPSFDYNTILVADALVDMMVLIVGTGLELGIPLDRVWDEIHRTNMAKVGTDGSVRRRADGKVLKPDGWKKPDIAAMLEEPSGAWSGIPMTDEDVEQEELQQLKDDIVREACTTTKMVDLRYPEAFIEIQRKAIRTLCRQLESLGGVPTPIINPPERLSELLKKSAELDIPPVESLGRAAEAVGLKRSPNNSIIDDANRFAEERYQTKVGEDIPFICWVLAIMKHLDER